MSRSQGHRIAFLDFDGVISFSGSFAARLSGPQRIIRTAVARLNRLVVLGDARVVVSSTWRRDTRTGHGASAAQLGSWLRDAGFVGDVIGITPTHRGSCVRGAEIQAWIDAQCVAPSAVVILDDCEPMRHLAPWLTKTKYNDLLTDKNVDEALKILAKAPPTQSLIRTVAHGEML